MSAFPAPRDYAGVPAAPALATRYIPHQSSFALSEFCTLDDIRMAIATATDAGDDKTWIRFKDCAAHWRTVGVATWYAIALVTQLEKELEPK